MICIATSETDTATATLEKRLWDAADQVRADSGLKSQKYSGGRPQELVLGSFSLRFAEGHFAAQRAKLEQASASVRRGSRVDEPASCKQACTLEILVPPAAPLAKFWELADSFERQAVSLQHQLQNPLRTRNLLLSRPLSGQVQLL